MRKIFSAFLFAMLVGGLFFADIICINTVQAQIVPKKPAVPEFTVRYIEYPFDVPATEGVNTYTGETWTIPGYSGVTPTIEIIIKNPQGYSDICYNVRYKGHYGTSDDDESWTKLCPQAIIGGKLFGGFSAQSNSEYTTLSFPHGELPSYIGDGAGVGGGLPMPYGGMLDLQVEAMSVILKESWYSTIPGVFYHYSVEEISGWSNTKSVTIPAFNLEAPNQIDPTPSPTYTTGQPELQPEITIAGFSLTVFILVFSLCAVVVVLTTALVYKRKKLRQIT